MKTKLKVAVLGVGSLGKEHARIYAEMAAAGQIEFAGLHDVSPQQAARIAEKYRVPVFASVDEAIAGADA
ncbi:MAG TPA: Gfo/Idh/MocA family oxidoreductase, partial [Candidatus Saccharimonadales bacterium]|nr:Gfo/Idh/MocA family oxidoreductase [Candidatus Saccharimonadales bacterium]